MKIGMALILATAAAFVVAAAASAHATMNPEKAPADSFSGFALRIPNEKNVATVKVSVQLPAGLDEVTFQTKPGWKRTESGRVVTWSGGTIGVGEFDDFGLSMDLPASPGTTLVFPATQTYANGDVVHWIGAQTSDEPAPHIVLEDPAGEATPSTTISVGNDSGDGDGLAIGLAIAALAVGLAALGMALTRRKRA